MSLRDKKKEEDGIGAVFQNLDKTTVLQEAKYFNSSAVNPRKCAYILTKLIYLLNQGEGLTIQEATDVFFATTKLFQSNDVMLRRLVYLSIKELSSLAQDVIIVTSSLTKDMTGTEDLYRAAAIRVLCCITDSSMLQAIERYMKEAIVDKNPAVSSAALVSALHLSVEAPDVVRRWVDEAQEAMTSENAMVPCHSFAVVSGARSNDRLSTVKLVLKLTGGQLRHSPYGLCLLIRHAAKLAEEDPGEGSELYMQFIESCLRHKSELVVYEAAHAIVNLRETAKDLAPAVSVLQIFCGSSKATLRLAGARTLATLTIKHPNTIAACAVDLENLISDPNRSVATLAVTTLLATGAESTIDRLMKQISSFMSEISDDFKIVVVNAIRGLCFKFPRKHHMLSSFLASMLREEGGLEYKSAIAEVLIDLVEENPDAKDTGLAHLCEFIEDCEHSTLSVRILHLLGREGPKTRQPSKYIRFMYNRVFLESGPVRAAAISAVARFGAVRPELLSNVSALLQRCHLDDEDEVRDRAIFYSSILDSNNEQLITDYIINVRAPDPILLEKALANHLATTPDEPFNISTVPDEKPPQKIKDPALEMEARKAKMLSLEQQYAEQLKLIPDIRKYGPLFKTSLPVDLTEAESEYVVHCVKHVFTQHLILQFECLNTIRDQLMEQVHVRLDLPPGYIMHGEVACDHISYNTLGSIFAIVEFPENEIESMANIAVVLEFVARDCDPTTGRPEPGEGYAESYTTDDIEIFLGDQMRTGGTLKNWDSLWEAAASGVQVSDTFGLSHLTVNAATTAVCALLGLPESVVSGDSIKEIRGDCLWRAGVPVMLKARLIMVTNVVNMEICVRSPVADISTLVLTALC